jgi:hypothetical protein
MYTVQKRTPILEAILETETMIVRMVKNGGEDDGENISVPVTRVRPAKNHLSLLDREPLFLSEDSNV